MRSWPTLYRLALPLAAAALVACAGATGARTDDPADRVAARRAALARVTVENRTPRPLAIAYRLALSGGEVVVGDVEAGDTARVAPIVAGEPVVLLARAPDGAVLRLPARTFDIGASWTWVIPADAAFDEAAGGGS